MGAVADPAASPPSKETLVETCFWQHATEHPERLAVVDHDGTEVGFGALLEASNQVVHGLRAIGLQAGDCVAVVMPNSAVTLEIFMAISQAGWRMTPVNCYLAAPEIAYILEDSGARALIGHERFGDRCRKAAEEAGLAASRCFAVGSIEGFANYESLKQGQSTALPDDRLAGGPMTYTSGTTGRPKGVRRAVGQGAPEVAFGQQALFLSLFGIFPGSSGVHLVVAPLYHTAVINFASNHLHLGHTVVLMDKWTPEGMLQRIERYGVTNSHMVPTHFVRLLKLPDEVRKQYDVSTMSHAIHGAAPCPVDVKAAMLDW